MCLDDGDDRCLDDGGVKCLDSWEAGLGGDATVVVTVTGHHDVTFQSPRLAPAVQHRVTVTSSAS